MASFPFCDSGPLITKVIVIPAAHIVVTTLNICGWYTSLLTSRYNNTNITYLRRSMHRLSKIDVSTFECVDLRRPMIDVSTFEDR